jgi:RimJ/RimL family protein N-acetyltransferase
VSERVLEKAGFIREELVRDAFEVVDFESGEKSTRDAVPWRFERPSRQKG